MSSFSSTPPPRSNSSSRSSYNGSHGLQGPSHNRRGSNSTLSVHSVSIRDPCYRDLQTLQADHAALYNQLKQTQQTLQHSYQDAIMAQERSKRAEIESGRLRNQMDNILKKHVDHHPEREALVQELGELQNRYEIEIGARRVLEKEHSALQHELLQLRLNNGVTGTSSSSKGLLPPPPPASPASSFSGAGGAPSPTSSIRSSTFSFLSGGSSGRRKSRISLSNDRPTSTKSARITETEEVLLGSPQSIHRQQSQSQSLPQTPTTPSRTWTTQASTPLQGADDGVQLVQDPDHEMLSQFQAGLPSWEQLEADKLMLEQLKEENVSMRLELNDLRYRNQAEKSSIKSYMSLFESLQKKQANALTVAQAEIDLLRSSLQEHILRLDSRESLIQTFAATVNNQAIELESLTKKTARDTASRAQLEQEMASLLEATVLILERLFNNVERTRSRVVEVLDPIRQTVHHMDVPTILEEWRACEQGVQSAFNDLASSLIRKQEAQEWEITTGNVSSPLEPLGASTLTFHGSNENMSKKDFNQRRRGSNFSTTSSVGSQQGSISSNRAMPMAMSTTISTNDPQSSNMAVLDNSASQDVFVWRRSMADTFLEDCVKSVETLATEKRGLQTRIVELTRALVDQDERKRLEEMHSEKSKITELDDKLGDKEKQENSTPQETLSAIEDGPVEKKEMAHGEVEEKQDTASEPAVKQSESNDVDLKSRADRLEELLTKVLAWTESQMHSSATSTHDGTIDKVMDAKKPAEARDVDDDILALGISSPLTVVRAETDHGSNSNNSTQVPVKILTPAADQPAQAYLGLSSDSSIRVLIDLIRQELSKTTQGAFSSNDQQSSEIARRPLVQVISTDQRVPPSFSNSLRGLVSPMSSSSTVSSCSSSSGYFFASTTTTTTTTTTTSALGRLSSSASLPSPGFSPTGEILDVDALCRDLAFRNFPKQHQWTKRKSRASSFSSTSSSASHKDMLLPWNPLSSSVLAATLSQSSTFTLPPRPPAPIVTLSK
ncbi:hypothetical protein EMPS_06047 [Entomortierella parvispora]|uniref:Uncharacterized protein n=1 Tax=Entomortierella parvispora TaxID=205924 RepID=A0A9P3LX31_9FUNG|nr:hypothetical protein EMPS_06047 [Entomortierella parvispora]